VKVIVCSSYEELSKKAAEIFAQRILQKPNIILGLATGGTPVGTYKELIRLHNEHGLDFSQVVTFNLDEYVGLAPSHPQSYRYFMDKNLFDAINIKKENTHILSGTAEDVEAECASFEEKIASAGGIDLQVLGIGSNGHIAFNEPGTSRDCRTHVVNLAESTIQDNARFFDDPSEIPRQALTLGIGTIMEAREIILLASGQGKAQAIARSVERPITLAVPASALQVHPNTVFIIDQDAASQLKREYPQHSQDLEMPSYATKIQPKVL